MARHGATDRVQDTYRAAKRKTKGVAGKGGGSRLSVLHREEFGGFSGVNQKYIMSKEYIRTYIYLRNRGQIAEEVVSRTLLVLKLKNGSTVRIPITRQIRKAVIR